ncbi:hypothetical protein HGRIS_007077 [Hohenbuehelia grisea]|uniref:Protein kinase domain-containing protein n=1 Tax=Hohenbuehelia grisea TaxID=104357 RepID=A0ABR3JB30_9AGAR
MGALELNLPPPPKAPSDKLRLDAFRIFARLEHIPELQSWITLIKTAATAQSRAHNLSYTHEARYYRLMWDCVALGAPLCVLLDLLGSPSSANGLYFDPDEPGAQPGDREKMFGHFIQRVHVLEIQGRMAYGEVLRVDDFVRGSASGFGKILGTVERVLGALNASFPGLFVLPVASISRDELLDDLLATEQGHVDDLHQIFTAAQSMTADHGSDDPSLECLVVHLPRLIVYHTNILNTLECSRDDSDIDWETVLTPHPSTNPLHARSMGSYKSFCANYLALMDLVEACITGNAASGSIERHARTLRRLLPSVLTRLPDYAEFLHNFLALTSPALPRPFDTVCRALFRLRAICADIDEIGLTLRTMRASRVLNLVGPSPSFLAPTRSLGSECDVDMGNLVLDDVLVVGATNDTLKVFLFETLLLCCRDTDSNLGLDSEERDGVRLEHMPNPTYPIPPWDVGPALRSTPLRANLDLVVVHAIPTSELSALRCLEDDTFEIDWKPTSPSTRLRLSSSTSSGTRSLLFARLAPAQCEQWCVALMPFIPSTRVHCVPAFGTQSAFGLGLGMLSDGSESISESSTMFHEAHTRASSQDTDITLEPSSDSSVDSPSQSTLLTITTATDILANPRTHTSKPRPWSVIGRKGTRSEASSMIHQELDDLNNEERVLYTDTPLSPTLLPRLFSEDLPVSPRSPVQIPNYATHSLIHGHVHSTFLRPLDARVIARGAEVELSPATPTPIRHHLPSEDPTVPDLTGEIEREGDYPAAHGGYSDVWKGMWKRRVGEPGLVKVAVKVLRAQHLADATRQEKLERRLHRELSLWKTLSHKNVIPLLGTTSDFGPGRAPSADSGTGVKAMVCPWYDNGTVSAYMERFGDVLGMGERLVLLGGVASGLAYLHDHSVVHGDLTGVSIALQPISFQTLISPSAANHFSLTLRATVKYSHQRRRRSLPLRLRPLKHRRRVPWPRNRRLVVVNNGGRRRGSVGRLQTISDAGS